ncbi:MAG: alpha/beta hydrolase [Verrucomicrobiota bacterium]|nr:alpha/beta hydrolase [Verrucomicrobiota bacterium]
MLPELFRDLGVPSVSRLRSQSIRVNGCSLHSRSSETLVADAAADRIPFLLIHGLVISSLYMIPLAERIAAEHEVHALDLPGFGRSEAPREVLTVPQLAEWVLAWMDAKRLPQCHLIANSLGCQIVAHLAVQAPERVATLTLIGPTLEPKPCAFIVETFRLLRDATHEPVRLWMNWLFDFCRTGPRRAFGTTREMFRDRIERQLPRVTARTLVMRGGLDPTVPQSAAEIMTRLLPNSRLLVIAGEPHCAHYTDPARVWRAITEHLRLSQPPRDLPEVV